ncbi:hypothetical protein [Pseudonocardia sp. C8]|nr:hypothetical protein [Pseudonocardia sp. C8]
MGGKPNPGTPKDRRLRENKPAPKKRGTASSSGKSGSSTRKK